MRATSNGTRIAKPKGGTPPPALTPCDLLTLAKAQMIALASGQAVAEVETPQLGRVSYTKADIPLLQRIIDGLAADCAALTGQPTAGRRRPISIEAWP